MEDKLVLSRLVIGDKSHPCHGIVDDPHPCGVHSTGREPGHKQPSEWIITHCGNQRDVNSATCCGISSDGRCAAGKWPLKWAGYVKREPPRGTQDPAQSPPPHAQMAPQPFRTPV